MVFVQAKWCKWLVSKDKKLYAPPIFCFFSCVNRPGQKFGFWYHYLSKSFGVFGVVYRILLKNVSALFIYFHLRDYKTEKLSRKTSSSLSTWVNNAILGGIPVAKNSHAWSSEFLSATWFSQCYIMATLAQHNDDSDTNNGDSDDSTDHPNSDNMDRNRRVFILINKGVSWWYRIKLRLKELSSILFVKYEKLVDFLSSKREVYYYFH